MRFTSFMGGCIGKVFTIILCILLGVVLTVGGVAGVGYFFLSKEGFMGTIEDKAVESGIEAIDFDEETEAMSVLQWFTELSAILGSFNTATIGEIEQATGYRQIATMLEEAIGIDQQIARGATFANLGETIAQELTVEDAQDTFQIEFPSLPIFSDPDFLADPLAEAFGNLNERDLTAFVEVDSAEYIAQAGGDYVLNDEVYTKVPYGTGDYIKNPNKSSGLMVTISSTKIGEMSDPDNGLEAKIFSLKLKEIIDLDDKAYIEQTGGTHIHNEATDTYTEVLSGTGTHVVNPDKSNAVLLKLQDCTIDELGSGATDDLINSMPLSDVIEIDGRDYVPSASGDYNYDAATDTYVKVSAGTGGFSENPNKSNSVLVALKDVAIGDLGKEEANSKIDNVLLKDLIEIDSEMYIPSAGGNYNYDEATSTYVEVTMGEGDFIRNPNRSNSVLICLQDTAIGDMGSPATDKKIKSMKLKELLTITNSSSKVLRALGDASLETQYEADNVTIKSRGIDDTIKILTLEEMVEGTVTAYVWNYLKTATLSTVGTKINTMCVKDVIEITATSHPVLRKMRLPVGEEDPALFGEEDVLVSEMGTKINSIVRDLTMNEAMGGTITETSPVLLRSLKDVKIKDLSSYIQNDLTMVEVFGADKCNSGVFALIDCENTHVTSGGIALTNAVKVSRMEVLAKANVVPASSINSFRGEIGVGVRDATMINMVVDYGVLLSGGPSTRLPTTHILSGDTISMAVIEGIASFDEGDILQLTQDTTVICEDFTKIFSIDVNGFTLTFEKLVDPETSVESLPTIRSLNASGDDLGGYIFILNNNGGTIVNSFDTDIAGIVATKKITVDIILS